MVTCQVNAGSLSSLLDTRGSIELIAEPYRLQQSVALSVPYSEYVKYIQMLPHDSKIALFSDTQTTLRYATTKDPRLYNSYLKDVAFAICKELFYSERCQEDATVIVPFSFNSESWEVSSFLQMVSVTPYLEQEFESLLKVHNHHERIRIQRNKTLKRLALAIYKLSSLSQVSGELCLAYDLS